MPVTILLSFQLCSSAYAFELVWCCESLFSVRVEACSSLFQSFGCQLLFLYSSVILVSNVTDPITILWILLMLARFMTVMSVTMLGWSAMMWSTSLLVFPSGFLYAHLPSAFCWNCLFIILNFFGVAHSTSVSSFISLAQAEASCRPF